MKLNLGCGRRHLDGYVNIDKEPGAEPDLLFDIEGERWAFGNASVEAITACHVLEHCFDLRWVMKEAYRVLIPGGLFHVTVPHHCSDGFWGDPTHVRPITVATLELFSKAKCAEFFAKGWPNTPLAVYDNVDFEIVSIETELMPMWAKKEFNEVNLNYCVLSYNNVVNEVRFTLRRV
jgi:ubiquinone/menaquinone biosynthesis C-methylase UbiE